MRHVLDTDAGSTLYRRRQQLIEPVFANTKHNRGINRVQRHGRAAVRTEWRLITATAGRVAGALGRQGPCPSDDS
jgi:hypothetical protein